MPYVTLREFGEAYEKVLAELGPDAPVFVSDDNGSRPLNCQPAIDVQIIYATEDELEQLDCEDVPREPSDHKGMWDIRVAEICVD